MNSTLTNITTKQNNKPSHKFRKILLICLVILPLVGSPILSYFWFIELADLMLHHPDQTTIPISLLLFFCGIFFLGLMMLVAEIIFVVNVFHNPKVAKERRVMWVVLLLFFFTYLAPYYWYNYVWRSKIDAARNYLGPVAVTVVLFLFSLGVVGFGFYKFIPAAMQADQSISNTSFGTDKVQPAGPATVAKLVNAPAGIEYQVYPGKLVSQTTSNYNPQSPIPPEADLEPGTSSSLLSFKASTWSQSDLVARCYPTWAVPAPDGGKLCGTDVVDGDPGQCTFWALLNFDSPNVYKVSSTARLNAGQFLAIAQTNGVPTSQTPTVGSMAVWAYTPNMYSDVGHVAIVVGVNQRQHTFVVSEMNANETPWRIDYRVVSSNPGGVGHGNLLGFILP